jgi:hypothetical protein
MDEARAAGLAVSVCGAPGQLALGALLGGRAPEVVAAEGADGAADASASAYKVGWEGRSLTGQGTKRTKQRCFATSSTRPTRRRRRRRPKQPPTPAQEAAVRAGVQPSECLVVLDRTERLGAATAAGMRCVVTYVPSTRWQEFPGATHIVSDLTSITAAELVANRTVQDDRIEMWAFREEGLGYGGWGRGTGRGHPCRMVCRPISTAHGGRVPAVHPWTPCTAADLPQTAAGRGCVDAAKPWRIQTLHGRPKPPPPGPSLTRGSSGARAEPFEPVLAVCCAGRLSLFG